jgi:hypothetical protein
MRKLRKCFHPWYILIFLIKWTFLLALGYFVYLQPKFCMIVFGFLVINFLQHGKKVLTFNQNQKRGFK